MDRWISSREDLARVILLGTIRRVDGLIGGFHREMRATSSIKPEIWAQAQLGYQAHISGGEQMCGCFSE